MAGYNARLKEKIVNEYGSQFMFALFMNEHESKISRVVRGQHDLPLEDRKRWAEALKVKDPDSLFTVEAA